MRSVLRVLFCLAVLLTATAAFAQYDGGDEVQSVTGISDGCGNTMDGEACFWSPMGGGNYTYCDAYGRRGQTCWASNRDTFSGNTFCDPVARSANCFCDDTTKVAKGMCTYYK